MTYIVRPMRVEDIPQVAEIDREAFPTQLPPPYSSFRRELHNRFAHYLVACRENLGQHQVTLARADGKSFAGIATWVKSLFAPERFGVGKDPSSPESVVGYAGFWLMVDEAHITSIAAREKYRRHGIGELLLIAIIDQATELNAKVVTLEVRVSNTPAQALYEKYGFNKVGRRRGYYLDNGEDGLLMSTDMLTSAPFQACFQELKRSYSKERGIACGFTKCQGQR